MSIKDLMKNFIVDNCFCNSGCYELSGGSSSNNYYDLKRATLDGYFLNLFTEYFFREVPRHFPVAPSAVGGLSMGADFMVSALSLAGYQKGFTGSMRGVIARKSAKAYGSRALIENNIFPSDILVVDDVLTSGASLDYSCDLFLLNNYKPVGFLVIVDREEGGCSYLAKKYDLPIISIFKASELNGKYVAKKG